MSSNSSIHIRMQGRDIVAGLLWQPPQRHYSAGQIRDVAKELDCSGYVMRRLSNRQLQVAFAPKGSASVGHYSLAAMLSQCVRHTNWAGVFALPDGNYFFICVLDGAVMPGTDVVGSFDEVRLRFVETIDLINGANQSLGVIYAPKVLGTDWQDEPLEEVVGKALFARSAKLRVIPGNMSRRSALIAAGTAVVGGAAIWYGVWGRRHFGWTSRTGAVQQAPSAAKIVDVPPPKPWVRLVDPAKLARFWIESLHDLPVSTAGWTLSRIRVDKHLISCEYTRGANALPVIDFVREMESNASLKVTVDETGAKASVDKSLKLFEPRDPAAGGVLYAQALRERWMSDFQRRGSTAPPLESVPPEAPSEDPPERTANVHYRWADPDWLVFKWAFRSPVSPDALFAGWHFPSLELTAMEMGDLLNGPIEWQLEGVIYARAS